jgi:hypothetical protein
MAGTQMPPADSSSALTYWNCSFAPADGLGKSVARAQTPNRVIDFIVFAMPKILMTRFRV